MNSNQKIICFEGPSAVGKTTLCAALNDTFSVIPEVNLLFERKENESKTWYLEKQVERFQLAIQSKNNSILDGDIFQPIWYNWACNYPSNFLNKSETHAFYKQRIIENNLRFPDLYIIFTANENQLRTRKHNDISRQRRNFEKHLKITSLLQPYYKFLAEETDVELKFLRYDTIDETKVEVQKLIHNCQVKRKDDLAVFEKICDWIEFQKRT